MPRNWVVSFSEIYNLLFKGKNYYGEFLQSEEKIATNTLAARLCVLEASGIITKSPDPGHGSKFIYRISEKGVDLLPMLVELILWSAKYDPNTAADPEFVELAMQDRDTLIDELRARLNAELREVK